MSHEIQKVDVKLLRPRQGNPNVLDGKGYAFLVKEIEKRGMVQPILVDKEYVIIDGEHRWRASMQLGLKEVDVVVVDMDALEAQIALINMNMIKGEFDPSKLGVMIEGIIDQKGRDELEKAVALDKSLLTDLIKDTEGKQVKKNKEKILDGYVPERDPDEWRKFPVDTGEIWRLDNHLLICGDVSEPSVVEKLMENADPTLLKLALLHPPTNANLPYNCWNDALAPERYFSYCEKWSKIAYRYCTDQVVILPKLLINQWMDAMLANTGIQLDLGFWISTEPPFYESNQFSKYASMMALLMGSRDIPEDYTARLADDFIEIPINDSFIQNKLHPDVLPKDILIELLKTFSNRGEIVFDPFIGSGTTFIAAQIVKRTIYGVEIDPDYCNLALTRWAKATGKTPVKVE